MAVAAVGAFFHTPGPKELYVNFRASPAGGGASGWQFLGTCVTAPDVMESPKFIDVFNDYGGRSVPTQLVWDGSESRLAVTLNRLDLAVARNIRDQSERIGTQARVGREAFIDRGSLVIGRTDFELIFLNTFFSTVNVTPGMPTGRYYFSVVLEGYEEHTTGTRVEEVTMLLRCNNVIIPNAGFAQYSEDQADFPVLTPN